MLIEHLIDLGEEKAVKELSVGDLDTFYREARAAFDAARPFATAAGAGWCCCSRGIPKPSGCGGSWWTRASRYFDDVYAKLGVLLTDDDIVGESFYNPMLPAVVDDLDASGLLVESDGARCVFPPGFTNRDGEPLPLIVQKSDGGFGYAATDLAAVRDRVDRLGATLDALRGRRAPGPAPRDDASPRRHGRMAARRPSRPTHVAFGSVLGADRKMFKTRAGDTVRLVDLIDEAVERAGGGGGREEFRPRSAGPGGGGPDASASARSSTPTSPPTASVTTSSTGTGCCLSRATPPPTCSTPTPGSVPSSAGASLDVPEPGLPPVLVEPAERALALSLLGFAEAVSSTLSAWKPSRLCAYLFDLATTFTGFYENCPVLKAPTDQLRQSRLGLSDLTARVLAEGLGLLGIDAPDQM